MANYLMLYTPSQRIVGQVNAGRRRLSDLLNDPQTSQLEMKQAAWQDLLMEGAPLVPAAQLSIIKDSIVLAVPRDQQVPLAPARVPTQPLAMHLNLGLLSVDGYVHRRMNDPRSPIALFLHTGRPFIPVSEAHVRYAPNPRFDAQEPVILLHARHLSFWTSEE